MFQAGFQAFVNSEGSHWRRVSAKLAGADNIFGMLEQKIHVFQVCSGIFCSDVISVKIIHQGGKITEQPLIFLSFCIGEQQRFSPAVRQIGQGRFVPHPPG